MCMKNSEIYTVLFETARSLGLADSQYEFSALCGRKQSWFSCAKSVNRNMSIGAMVSLAVSLQNLPPDRISRSARPHVKRLVASIWQLVEAKGSGKAI